MSDPTATPPSNPTADPTATPPSNLTADPNPSAASPAHSNLAVAPRDGSATGWQQRLTRADRALRCAPFRLALYLAMVDQSVALRSIAGPIGVAKGYTNRPIAELSVESELLWLIQVGLLRREVDGQGLTDSFRITPIGRQIVDQWQSQTASIQASLSDRLYNARSRWVRFPF
jgi:hypothetical protein